jgi:hypothetical protein
MLYGVDPRAKMRARRVLWQQDEPSVAAWDAHTMSPVMGQSTVYVLLELPRRVHESGMSA